MAVWDYPVCFNDDGELIPCGFDIVTSSDVSESISEYCGDYGQFCNDEEYNEVFKAMYR